MSGMNCYHHLDRPANASCSICGKGLCHECADTFQTTDGHIYCVDCYKKVVNENVQNVKKVRRIIIREFVFIMIGLIIGLIIGFTVANGGMNAVICAAAGGSIGTIIKQIRYARYKGWGWLWVILYAILMIIVSPIMTLYRIIVRIKDIVKLSKIARNDSAAIELADYFFKLARNPEARVENEKGEELDLDAIMADMGESIQVAHDGSISLNEMIHR